MVCLWTVCLQQCRLLVHKQFQSQTDALQTTGRDPTTTSVYMAQSDTASFSSMLPYTAVFIEAFSCACTDRVLNLCDSLISVPELTYRTAMRWLPDCTIRWRLNNRIGSRMRPRTKPGGHHASSHADTPPMKEKRQIARGQILSGSANVLSPSLAMSTRYRRTAGRKLNCENPRAALYVRSGRL